MTRNSVAKAILPIALALAGCGSPSTPSRLPIDASPSDASFDAEPIILPPPPHRDAGDSGSPIVDAAIPESGCTVGTGVLLTSVSMTSELAPVAVSLGSDTVIAWIETRLGQTDAFAVQVSATGDLGPEVRLTNDLDIETGLSLATSEGSFVAAYSHSLLGGTDLSSVRFNPSTGDLITSTDLTLDFDNDVSPSIFATAGGFSVVWERTLAVPGAFRLALSPSGAATDQPSEVSATLSFTAPYALDPTSGDIRLYHRLDDMTLESTRLTSDGVEFNPGGVVIDLSFPNHTLESRIRTSTPNSTPRGAVVASTISSDYAALLQRLTASGTATGATIEIDRSDSPMSATVATYASHLVSVYRSTIGGTSLLRLRAYRSTGARSDDLDLFALEADVGAVELVTNATGTSMMAIVDDTLGATRELRAYQLTCTLN